MVSNTNEGWFFLAQHCMAFCNGVSWEFLAREGCSTMFRSECEMASPALGTMGIKST